MFHLSRLLRVGLLRKLLTFANGSIKRLLLFFQFIWRRYLTRAPSHPKDTSQTSIHLPSQTRDFNGLSAADVVCASLEPLSGEADSNSHHTVNDQNILHSEHPLIPQSGHLLPYAYKPRGSRASQDMGTSIPEAHNSDAMDNPSPHANVLVPPSQDNPVQVASHLSRPLRIVAPMSTASIQRYNRNYIMYVFFSYTIHCHNTWLIYGTQFYKIHIRLGRSLEI
jgi:hypothetical protein